MGPMTSVQYWRQACRGAIASTRPRVQREGTVLGGRRAKRGSRRIVPARVPAGLNRTISNIPSSLFSTEKSLYFIIMIISFFCGGAGLSYPWVRLGRSGWR